MNNAKEESTKLTPEQEGELLEKFHTVNTLLTLISKELAMDNPSWGKLIKAHQDLTSDWSRLTGEPLETDEGKDIKELTMKERADLFKHEEISHSDTP